MIPVEYYVTIYYFLLSIILIFSTIPIFFGKKLSKVNFSISNILLIMLPILFIGLRDPYGSWLFLGDTHSYTITFYDIKNNSFEITKDPLFYSLMYFFSLISNVEVFYLFCSICYVLLPFYLFRNIEKKYVFILTALHICSFSFWGFGANGLRNGLAVALFLYGLKFLNKKPIYFYILALLSTQLHASLFLPLIAFSLSFFYKNTKFYLNFWLISIIISFFYGKKIQSTLEFYFSLFGFKDDRVNVYSIENNLIETFQTTIFRLDFVIYSALPVLLGYLLIFKHKYFNQF